MSTHSELLLYIGREYNENTKAEIEDKFRPYRITICDIDYFYLENYMTDTIRCVVENEKIVKLKFN